MIAYGGLIGSATSSTSVTALTIAVPAGGVPVGSLVVVALTGFNFSAGAPAVTDARLNAYQADNTFNSGAEGINEIFSSLLTTALQAGDTIVVAVPASDQGYAAEAFYFTGIAAASWHYQSTALAHKTSSTTPSVAMALSSPPSPMVFVAASMLVFSAAALTPAAGWTGIARVQSGTGASDVMIDVAYRVEAATPASETWGPTYGSAVAVNMGMDAYQGIAGGPVRQIARSFLDSAGMP